MKHMIGEIKMKLILCLVSLSVVSMLVPPSALGQGDFSIFVTDDDAIHQLDLKATEGQNGQVNQVSGFAIEANSVVQVKQNENLKVFTSTNEPVRIEKVKVADPSGQLIELTKTSNEWSLQGFDDGVYLLDVIVNMPSGEKGAFETVLVILAPNTQNADPNQVVKQVVKTDTKVVFRDQKPKPKPIGNPYCDLVSDDYRGACHDRKDYDELTGLYPCRDGSDVKDWRDCKDAGKHPAEKKYPIQRICTAGMDAGSLACSEGITVEQYCAKNPQTQGCPRATLVPPEQCGALITLACPLGPGFPEPIECATGWHLDERNTCQPDNPSNPALGFAALPPCDGTFRDCIYNGHLCKAGSTEHACELPLAEEPAIANDCVLVPTAPGCAQTLVRNDPYTGQLVVPNEPFMVPNFAEGEEPSCQPEDDFCEPGCESPSMDCIDDVNVGDDGVDSVPDEEEEQDEEPEEEEAEEPEEPIEIENLNNEAEEE